MKDIVKFFKKKEIDKVLKKIKVKELVEYINKYIGDNLEVGGKYQLSYFQDKGDIHRIITENIKKGLHELWQKYGIDYAEMFDFIQVNTWDLRININYKIIRILEFIGKYDFDKKENKCFNSEKIILESLPKFELCNELHNKVIVKYNSFDIGNLSIYEFYIGLLEKVRLNAINNIEKEIVDYKRKIAERRLEIEKFENLLF